MLVNAMKQPSGLASGEALAQKSSVVVANGFNHQNTTESFNLQNVFDPLTPSFDHTEPAGTEQQSAQDGKAADPSSPMASTLTHVSMDMSIETMLGMLPSQHVASFGGSTALHNEHRIGRDLPSSMAAKIHEATSRESAVISSTSASSSMSSGAMIGIEATSVHTQPHQTPAITQSIVTQTPTMQAMVSEVAQSLSSTTESSTATKPEWAPIRVDTSAAKWGEQMMQVLHDRVTLQAQQNVQEAKIRLDPPDLGKLDVLVRVEGDRLSVQINANTAATREALMQVSERLRAELQEQNFVHVDVNVGSEQGQRSQQQEQYEEDTNIFSAKEVLSLQSNTPSYSEHWLNTQA
ncbi:Flagellar hook-length control protein FliK [Vibrio sp. B1REV9]|uniref:flagellar hook-length control protein FliK n=1 Tax=Vibrio sp. B1REV9 TaxID=2751179 RepID=UPI001AF3F5FF|nr:flagellar hook-length control protein FliK [Vibrio sp. B1REV9]CAE6931930.1 Flagellar hook-length control protein FliK [Vibrio sp. B1REV9]